MRETRQVKGSWTGSVVGRGTKLDVECELGGRAPGGVSFKDRIHLIQQTNLKLSLRGSVG